MKKITKFEDLIAWQNARELTKKIYDIMTWSKFEKNFGLKSQIQRASVSTMSNIAKGFDRAGRAEFHQHWSLPKVHVQKSGRNVILHTISAIYQMKSLFH
jgi:hypothetical protein